MYRGVYFSVAYDNCLRFLPNRYSLDFEQVKTIANASPSKGQ